MNHFKYSSVADVLVGPGTSDQLADLCKSLGIRRALIVTDPGIVKFGLLEAALKKFEANSIPAKIYSDVIADPPEAVVLDAVKTAQEFDCDGVIGFGGGSSMDEFPFHHWLIQVADSCVCIGTAGCPSQRCHHGFVCDQS